MVGAREAAEGALHVLLTRSRRHAEDPPGRELRGRGPRARGLAARVASLSPAGEELARTQRRIAHRPARRAHRDAEAHLRVGDLLEATEARYRLRAEAARRPPGSMRKSRAEDVAVEAPRGEGAEERRRRMSSSTAFSRRKTSASEAAAPSSSTATTRPAERCTRWQRPRSSSSSRVPLARARWRTPRRSPTVVERRRPGSCMRFDGIEDNRGRPSLCSGETRGPGERAEERGPGAWRRGRRRRCPHRDARRRRRGSGCRRDSPSGAN